MASIKITKLITLSAQPSEQAQKGLTNIAKTLQNVANNVTFGNKEEHMGWLNDFVSQNFLACQDYFDDVSVRIVFVKSVDSFSKRVQSNRAPTEVLLNPVEKEVGLENLLKHLKNIGTKLEEKVLIIIVNILNSCTTSMDRRPFMRH